MNAKTLSILAGLTVLVIVAAIFLGREQHEAFPQSGELLFPELMGKINDITEITVESKDDKITLVRNEGIWGVERKRRLPCRLRKSERRPYWNDRVADSRTQDQESRALRKIGLAR